MKQKLNGFLAIAAAGVLSLVLAPQANATVEIRLSDGTNTITVQDGQTGQFADSCAAANCVTFNGSIGVWDINVSTGHAVFGGSPSLDLHTLNSTTSKSAPTLTIWTTATDYTPSASAGDLFGGGSLNANGTYTFAAFIGNTNAAFDTSNQIGPTETFVSGKKGIGFSMDDFTSPITTASPYSVTIRSTLVFAVPAGPGSVTSQASSDAEFDLTPVPEPAVVSLLGGMMLFTVGAIRRRARRA
jgi:hypothetical protein